MHVYAGRDLVGQINLRRCAFYKRSKEICISTAEPDPPVFSRLDDLASAVVLKQKRIVLPMAEMRFRIPDRDLASKSQDVKMILAHNNVPDYAEPFMDFNRFETVYAWSVCKISRQQHEEIFDFDWFIPFEHGGMDYDARERSMEQYAMAAEFAKSQLKTPIAVKPSFSPV